MPGDFRQRYRYDHTVSPGDAEQAFAAADGAGNEVVIKLVTARDPDRFLREMQVASGIAHPSVARILDWGMDAERCYVVTEHVQGTRLESVLTAGPLQYGAAADVGEQVAAALSAVHAHGLVHGGVAASTITRMPDGTVRLQDLGLRVAAGPRALDPAAPRTAYVSPEEAAGYELTQASDQYALGALLYELVCGRPPLAAVTAPGQAPSAPVPLRALAPGIPYRLESTITRAMAWRPQERFGSIEELREELSQARLEIQPAPYPAPQPARPSETAVTTLFADQEEPPAQPRKSWLWAWILGLVVLVAVIGVLVAWALGAFSGGVSTPDLVGQSLSNAKATLSNAGLTLGTVSYQKGASAQTQGLSVTKQDPVADASVSSGSAVNVTLGTGTTKVPSVVGMTQAQASAALKDAGLSIATVQTAASSTVPKGKVVSQDPKAGTSVAKGSQVMLTVSSGTGLVTVPDVVGKAQTTAADVLQTAGFTVSATQKASSTIAEGDVISQSPAGGTNAKKGSKVTITVSSGASSAAVPSVVGQTQAAATSKLQNAGFTVDATTQASSTVASGSVISQNPSAGVQAQQGSTVSIVVSTGPSSTPTASPSP